jgi:hypothetical protein
MAAKWTDFVAGAVLTAAQLNDVVDNFKDIAIFNETQASGTNGGTATSGSFVKRTLNTTVINNIAGCSIASSVITLPAGTYQVRAAAPVFRVNSSQLRIFNNTASAIAGVAGPNLYTDNAGDNGGTNVVDTYFTLAVSSAIQLEQRVQTTVAAAGYGNGMAFGTTEQYSTVTITRVA